MKLRALLHGFRDCSVVVSIISAIMLFVGYAITFAVFALLTHFALQETKNK